MCKKEPLTVKGDTFLLCDDFNDELIGNVSSVAVLKTFKEKEVLLNSLEEREYSYTYIKRASLDNQEILKNKEDILKDKDYISLILGRKEESK